MTLAAFRRGYGQSGEVAAAGSQVVLAEGQQPIVVAITVRRQGLQLRVFEERLLGERESELGTTPVPAALLVREPTHHHVQICRGDGTKRHATAIIEGVGKEAATTYKGKNLSEKAVVPMTALA